MSVVKNITPTPIIFTDEAAAKVKDLVEEENNKQLKLRVYVTGGGCSGFQYGFIFDLKVAEDDTVITNGDAEMVIDSLSYQYLVGAAVDYEEGLQGSKFLVKNPNAKSTCGCGSSFSI
ncbi:MAG: iron-sulfur cluster insertion protein ErpA [Candidatus Endonucleobacter bathymodioli]|uniref:Iron-sulfur cluster insertion protein ErpA n=1 Tax=Candidatus Endonucleibacter bathymodioli TaxID=539814 RepID=A0AA90NZ24_9GAMM|nr:iron-sulfur cluster insertion protein ErpA [Candidatus Endonucleobacter bathymodioli]